MKNRQAPVFVSSEGTLPKKACPLLWASDLCLPIFAFLLFFATAILAYESPGRPTGFVNDFANIISNEQETVISSQISQLEMDMGVEIAVVTVPSLGDETIETYAVKLFEEWGVGKAKQDNGLLFLVAPNEREIRIEVGYGLESIVTDIAASTIIREITIPAFRGGQYGQGIENSVGMIIGLIRNNPEAVGFIESHLESSVGLKSLRDLPGFVFFIFIFVVQLIPVIIYSKSWWLGGVIGFIVGFILFTTWIAVVLAAIGFLADYLLSKKFGGKRPPGSHGGVWFGGFGGGRSGGGFGGFGGGMSGGGGASGRW